MPPSLLNKCSEVISGCFCVSLVYFVDLQASPSNSAGRTPPRQPSSRSSPLTSPTNCSHGGLSPRYPSHSKTAPPTHSHSSDHCCFKASRETFYKQVFRRAFHFASLQTVCFIYQWACSSSSSKSQSHNHLKHQKSHPKYERRSISLRTKTKESILKNLAPLFST